MNEGLGNEYLYDNMIVLRHPPNSWHNRKDLYFTVTPWYNFPGKKSTASFLCEKRFVYQK